RNAARAGCPGRTRARRTRCAASAECAFRCRRRRRGRARRLRRAPRTTRSWSRPRPTWPRADGASPAALAWPETPVREACRTRRKRGNYRKIRRLRVPIVSLRGRMSRRRRGRREGREVPDAERRFELRDFAHRVFEAVLAELLV